MKKLGILTAFLLAACSSSKHPAQPAEPMSMTEPTPPSEMGDQTAAAESSEVEAPASDTAPGMGGEQLEPAEPPAPPAPPPPPMATANLVAIKDGAAMGTLQFEQKDNMISMSGTFTGLPPGMHALYIHEVGDCTKKGAKVGKHLDPTKAKHGPPSSANRHAGDLGNLTVDADGNASFQMDTDSITMDDIGRADTIIHRSVVVHAKKDDAKGSGGAPLACGVIEKVEGDASQQTAAH